MENNKKTFKEMWHDKRMHAIIVLGMWFTFFALVFIILGILSLFNTPQTDIKKEEIQNEIVVANISKMLENLIESDYSYEFKINYLENSYSYIGTKETSKNEGYYESVSGIIKYSVVDGVYYQLLNDELLENSNIISNQDKELMDLEIILEKIKEYEINNEVINENNKYIYELLINDVLWQVDIYTSANDINEIVLKSDNYNYDLIFKNIVRK